MVSPRGDCLVANLVGVGGVVGEVVEVGVGGVPLEWGT